MTTLTITSEDQKAINQVKELAKKLNVDVKEDSEQTSSQLPSLEGKGLTNLLKEWHKHGGMKTEIEDPVSWQREVRKDRKLPFGH